MVRTIIASILCFFLVSAWGAELKIIWLEGEVPGLDQERREIVAQVPDEHVWRLLGVSPQDEVVPVAGASRLAWLRRVLLGRMCDLNGPALWRYVAGGAAHQVADLGRRIDNQLTALEKEVLAHGFTVERRPMGSADLPRIDMDLSEKALFRLLLPPEHLNLFLVPISMAAVMAETPRNNGIEQQELAAGPPEQQELVTPGNDFTWSRLTEEMILLVKELERDSDRAGLTRAMELARRASGHPHLADFCYMIGMGALNAANSDRSIGADDSPVSGLAFYTLGIESLGDHLSEAGLAMSSQIARWSDDLAMDLDRYKRLWLLSQGADSVSVWPYRALLAYYHLKPSAYPQIKLTESELAEYRDGYIDRVRSHHLPALENGIVRRVQRRGRAVHLPESLRGTPLWNRLGSMQLRHDDPEPPTALSVAAGTATIPNERFPVPADEGVELDGLVRVWVWLLLAATLATVIAVRFMRRSSNGEHAEPRR